jgi:hypothetical protein
VVPAQPNTNLVFRPQPRYWLTAGDIVIGQVLDPEQIENVVEVPFDGEFAMGAKLDSQNNWTVFDV